MKAAVTNQMESHIGFVGDDLPFLVTLVTGSGLHSIRLPAMVDGEFFLAIDGNTLVSIVAKDKKWYVSGLAASLYDQSNNPIRAIELHDSGYWYVFHGHNRHILMAEECSQSNNTYNRYAVQNGAALSIGRKPECDIRFKNPFVSKQHAVLSNYNGTFRIQDNDSTNGVFVNGARVIAKELEVGDVVSVQLHVFWFAGHRCRTILQGYGDLRASIQALWPAEWWK